VPLLVGGDRWGEWPFHPGCRTGPTTAGRSGLTVVDALAGPAGLGNRAARAAEPSAPLEAGIGVLHRRGFLAENRDHAPRCCPAWAAVQTEVARVRWVTTPGRAPPTRPARPDPDLLDLLTAAARGDIMSLAPSPAPPA